MAASNEDVSSTTTTVPIDDNVTAASSVPDEAGAPAKQPLEKDPRFPIKVEYCTVCGLPIEYCEYGPCYERCKAADPAAHQRLLEQQQRTLATGTAPAPATTDHSGRKRGGKGTVKPPPEPGTAGETKILPGGKVKKVEPPKISIVRTQRNKRKYITSVAGLEGFSVKLPDASKMFAKTFSCGAAIIKGPPTVIEIQGDVTTELTQFMHKTWAIPLDSINVQEK